MIERHKNAEGNERSTTMLTRVIFFLLLLALWLLLSSQHIEWIIGLGVVSAVLVVWLGSRMGILGADLHTFGFYLRLPWYAMWLLGRITISCVRIAMIILRPSLPISPGFLHVPMTQKKDLGKLVHANSITLTPGTVSTKLEDQHIEVHALNRDCSTEWQVQLDRKVSQLEGEGG